MRTLHNNLLEHGILFLLLFLGGFLFFTNLSWGEPLFFHPDERNIASAISQIHAPDQMHPHFFAYGSLPLYAIYFVGVGINFFSTIFSSSTTDIFLVTFEQAILIARGFSALFATILIPVVYFLGKKLKDSPTGLLAAGLLTGSVGIVQYAHFGTFEMWLTFFSVLLFWACLQYTHTKRVRTLLGIGMLLGILVAIKISSLIFIPLIALVLITHGTLTFPLSFKALGKKIGYLILAIIFVLCVGSIIYILTNPYVLLATDEFMGSMKYESEVALGTLPVFYTGEFFETIPVLYHLIAIYPFLLNPLVLFLFLISLIWHGATLVKKPGRSRILLLLFFCVLFFSQTFLFVKWVRYLIPTLPFIYLLTAWYLRTLLTGKRIHEKLPGALFLICVFLLSGLFVFSYLFVVLISPDTRVQAASWARQSIPAQSAITSEVYDLGITAFNPYFPHITLANAYDLDTHQGQAFQQSEKEKISSGEYIILPSQRIYKTRLRNKKSFPQGHTLYRQITSSNAYTKIYETPCNTFCRILYLGDPIFRYEGTANVFDRPTVMIYKKK